MKNDDLDREPAESPRTPEPEPNGAESATAAWMQTSQARALAAAQPVGKGQFAADPMFGIQSRHQRAVEGLMAATRAFDTTSQLSREFAERQRATEAMLTGIRGFDAVSRTARSIAGMDAMFQVLPEYQRAVAGLAATTRAFDTTGQLSRAFAERQRSMEATISAIPGFDAASKTARSFSGVDATLGVSPACERAVAGLTAASRAFDTTRQLSRAFAERQRSMEATISAIPGFDAASRTARSIAGMDAMFGVSPEYQRAVAALTAATRAFDTTSQLSRALAERQRGIEMMLRGLDASGQRSGVPSGMLTGMGEQNNLLLAQRDAVLAICPPMPAGRRMRSENAAVHVRISVRCLLCGKILATARATLEASRTPLDLPLHLVPVCPTCVRNGLGDPNALVERLKELAHPQLRLFHGDGEGDEIARGNLQLANQPVDSDEPEE